MNKLVKGAIAAAVGIALLMGGASTLAFWNDSASIPGGSISAGTLSITATTPAPGTDGWKSGATAIPTIANFRIIPGDTITYTKTFTVTATGNNLTATAALTGGAITAASAAAADTKLAQYLTKTAVFTVGGVSTSTVNASAGTQTVVVTVSITFPNGTAANDNLAKSGSVNLDAFAITLTQN
ncbi:MAG: alternate-type signal peptide domain-containing protein [Rhodoglobus sp.]|nr:alternate-type signal peptide domain-containing protein [Rhodoglobus sp.]